jgi:hypothetical protein
MSIRAWYLVQVLFMPCVYYELPPTAIYVTPVWWGLTTAADRQTRKTASYGLTPFGCRNCCNASRFGWEQTAAYSGQDSGTTSMSFEVFSRQTTVDQVSEPIGTILNFRAKMTGTLSLLKRSLTIDSIPKLIAPFNIIISMQFLSVSMYQVAVWQPVFAH